MCKDQIQRFVKKLQTISKSTAVDLITAKAALQWIKGSIVPQLSSSELNELHEYTFSLNLMVAEHIKLNKRVENNNIGGSNEGSSY